MLIHGAAGGVGTFAVQLARWRGARVTATASAANLDFVRSLGADEVIDYRATRFEDAVGGVDAVFDTVGGETLARSRAVLKEGGKLVTIAASEERPGGLLYRCARGEFALFQSAGGPSGSHTQMSFEVDDLEAVVAELRSRGVAFEEYDAPGLTTVDGIAEVSGNYPSKGGIGERAAWFKDSEGNLIGIGQAVT